MFDTIQDLRRVSDFIFNDSNWGVFPVIDQMAVEMLEGMVELVPAFVFPESVHCPHDCLCGISELIMARALLFGSVAVKMNCPRIF